MSVHPPPHGPHGAGPEALAGLGAVGRVARALVGGGTLAELGERALGEMRDGLELDIAALYVTDPTGRPNLRRQVTCAAGGSDRIAQDDLAFDEEAWRLAILSGSPLVFHEPASWLVDHPFQPPADSWLVLPLASGRSMVGVVIAAGSRRLSLGPSDLNVLVLLGDLLSAGIATARLRQEVQRTEVERERLRLAADVHGGLAQDLALAVRELAFLDTEPASDVAESSRQRLREALTGAHRIVRAQLEDLAMVVPLGGIEAAIEEVRERHESRGLSIQVVSRGRIVDVSPASTAVILRVVNEALDNVARHAGARMAEVVLHVEDERLTVAVEDDGRGFDAAVAPGPADGHFGLTIMRDRARAVGGRLEVARGRLGGARVTLQVPLDADLA